MFRKITFFSEFLSPQFRSFLITGGIAACVNVGSRIIYNRVMSYSAAVVLAYICGMITAYLLARRYVFADSDCGHAESTLRFAIVNVLGVLQTWMVSTSLGYYALPALGLTRHARDLAHVIGVATPAFTSFVMHRYWTFRSKRTPLPTR